MNYGHRLDDVKRYTPKQAFAFLAINGKIEKTERFNDFTRSWVAAQGDAKSIKQMSKDLKQ